MINSPAFIVRRPTRRLTRMPRDKTARRGYPYVRWQSPPSCIDVPSRPLIFEMRSPDMSLASEYQFHTKTARHFFCKVCGIYPFHRKRVTPDNLG